jgi:hypothetical protein
VTITVNTPDGGTAQFPDGTPTSAMTSALQAKFGGPSGAKSGQAYEPGTFGKIADIASNSATLGLSPLLNSAVGQLGGALGIQNRMPSVAEANAKTSQEERDVGPVTSALANTAGYMTPGKVLGPIAQGIAGTGLAGTALEGGLAGGIYGAATNPQDPVSSGLSGAAWGGGLGAAAHGVGAGIAKLTSSPGSVDPAAAIASTKTARDALYQQLQSTPVGGNSLKNAYASATLTPGMAADVSPGFNALIGRQLAQVDAGGISANDVADFAKNLKAGATSNGDQILAGKISDNLLGALPPEAQQTLQAADAAHKQYMMAQNLAEWQRKTAAGGSPGQAPLTEAENFYQNDPQSYKTLAGLANQGGGHSAATWGLGHMAATALGFGGEALAGFPGAMVGEGLGYLFAKPAIYKAMKGVDARSRLKAFQAAYPQMTGQQPVGGSQTPPVVGDAIKNLMLGNAY